MAAVSFQPRWTSVAHVPTFILENLDLEDQKPPAILEALLFLEALLWGVSPAKPGESLQGQIEAQKGFLFGTRFMTLTNQINSRNVDHFI